jgi:SagB-type dehydrogenase family enzyme
VPGTAIVHAVLSVFNRWRPASAAAKALPHATRRQRARLVNTLVELTLLQRSDRPRVGIDTQLRDWRPWGTATSFFHFATRDVRFAADVAEVNRRMRAKARREPMPPAVKRYRGAPTLALPATSATGEFLDVLRGRRTWRKFATTGASLRDLSDVLGLTFGIQRWVELPGIGRVGLKSSPSGGARHPIECYVVALRVRGLSRGLYHYRPDTHALERLPRPTGVRDVTEFLPGQPWYAGASAVVLMTAVFARTRWKYRHGRAYRVILAEAGHLGQTFCLAATWRGLAPFCTMALADTVIERQLGIDGVSEAVIYAAGFGTRPAGADWAPWPDLDAVKRARRARASASTRRSGSARSQKRRNSS